MKKYLIQYRRLLKEIMQRNAIRREEKLLKSICGVIGYSIWNICCEEEKSFLQKRLQGRRESIWRRAAKAKRGSGGLRRREINKAPENSKPAAPKIPGRRKLKKRKRYVEEESPRRNVWQKPRKQLASAMKWNVSLNENGALKTENSSKKAGQL